MNILAIDTCTEVCSVSLLSNQTRVSRFVKDVAKSSGLILPLCDEVFSEVGIDVSELDQIVYTKGPGAFTGVRMCVGVVQGMSLAHDIPTMGFSTLEVVGFGATKKYQTNKVGVALDARMGEVYWGVYEDQVLSQESLRKPEAVDRLNQDYIGVGTAWGVYQDALILQSGIEKCNAEFYPKAENLIDLYLAQPQSQDVGLPLPSYLRNNVAKKSLK